MAVVIGAMSAFVAYVLVWLIGAITNLVYYHRLSSQRSSRRRRISSACGRCSIPMVGGLIVGLMARYGSEKIRGHGIPEAMEAILIGRSRMDAKVAILKPLSSAISIGTGGPFGAEGPIIMTGGAFGSLFAQVFHLSRRRAKDAARRRRGGGNVGDLRDARSPRAHRGRAAAVRVEAAQLRAGRRRGVVAVALRVPLLGAGPIFPVAPHAALTCAGAGVALRVGIVAGLGSALLTALVYGAEDLFGSCRCI